MEADAISQFDAAPAPRRWRKGYLLKIISLKEIDCLLDIIGELSGPLGRYVSVEDFVATCARCHCQEACGRCIIPKAWALERLENYASLDVVAFGDNDKTFRLVAFWVDDCSGNSYRRTTDSEADFQTCLEVQRDLEEVHAKLHDQGHHLEGASSRTQFKVEDYQGVIVVSDDEAVPTSKPKSKRSRVDKDAAFAAKLAAKEANDADKESRRALQRANRTLRQFHQQAARKKAAAANKFARQVAAKNQRRTISLTRACPLGYCRQCYAKLTPAFLKYSATSPGNYDLYLGFARQYMLQYVVARSITVVPLPPVHFMPRLHFEL
jgi:hypothetical protein